MMKELSTKLAYSMRRKMSDVDRYARDSKHWGI